MLFSSKSRKSSQVTKANCGFSDGSFTCVNVSKKLHFPAPQTKSLITLQFKILLMRCQTKCRKYWLLPHNAAAHPAEGRLLCYSLDHKTNSAVEAKLVLLQATPSDLHSSPWLFKTSKNHKLGFHSIRKTCDVVFMNIH